MLMSFQSDLGSISSEILYLQRKSVSMSQQLHNRQAVRGRLSQFIDDMAVSETLIMYVRHWSFHMEYNKIFIVQWFFYLSVN